MLAQVGKDLPEWTTYIDSIRAVMCAAARITIRNNLQNETAVLQMPFWPFMGIFWVIIVILISWAGWWSRGYRRDSASETSALDILKQRYAKGEISKAEFDEMKKDIA